MIGFDKNLNKMSRDHQLSSDSMNGHDLEILLTGLPWHTIKEHKNPTLVR